MTTNEPLKRREVLDLAKRLVLDVGPSIVLEFGFESAENRGWVDTYGRENVLAVVAEAHRQADRVYAFLGYESRF